MIQIIKEEPGKPGEERRRGQLRIYANGRTMGIRGYNTAADRLRAIRGLRKQGFDRFTCFQDVKSDYALMYGCAPEKKEEDHSYQKGDF